LIGWAFCRSLDPIVWGIILWKFVRSFRSSPLDFPRRKLDGLPWRVSLPPALENVRKGTASVLFFKLIVGVKTKASKESSFAIGFQRNRDGEPGLF